MIEVIQSAKKIYNIGSVNTARFVYEAYQFDAQTIYNIEHIEHAQFLFKSADYQELEEKINNLSELVTLTAANPEKQAKHTGELEKAMQQKEFFIEDVRNLYQTISALSIAQNDEQLKDIKALFTEGKFREANLLLNQATLKKEKDTQLKNIVALKAELENNAEKYILKARLAMTDLSNENRMATAMECFEEAIDNSEKISSPNTFIRKHDYGIFLMSASTYVSKAISVFTNALTALPASGMDQTSKESFAGAIYNFLGEQFVLLNQYQQAEINFNQSIAAFRTLTAQYPETFVDDLIGVYNNRGNFKWQSGRQQEAVQDYTNCDYLFKQIPAHANGTSKPLMAFVYNNLGNVFNAVQEYATAETYYTEAYTMLLQLEADNPGTYPEKIALSFNNIAWAQSMQGNYATASANYTKSITQYRKLVAENGSNYLPDLARALCNFGIMLHGMANYHDAATQFSESKKIYSQLAILEPDAYYPSLATVLEYEGEMLFEKKDYPVALQNFSEAAEIRIEQAKKHPQHFAHFAQEDARWIVKIKQAMDGG